PRGYTWLYCVSWGDDHVDLSQLRSRTIERHARATDQARGAAETHPADAPCGIGGECAAGHDRVGRKAAARCAPDGVDPRVPANRQLHGSGLAESRLAATVSR